MDHTSGRDCIYLSTSRVTHLLANFGWVDFDFGDVPPSCSSVQQVLPLSHQPRQNQAEGVKAKIKVNPTQVSTVLVAYLGPRACGHHRHVGAGLLHDGGVDCPLCSGLGLPLGRHRLAEETQAEFPYFAHEAKIKENWKICKYFIHYDCFLSDFSLYLILGAFLDNDVGTNQG